jgi:serine/threonine protein kinase
MNSTSHDAQTRHADEALRHGQAFRDDEPPELDAVADPTEDLANDVTSELPGPGIRLRVVPPNVIGPETFVVNGESAGSATVATSGAVLRDRYILEQPLGYGGTSVIMRARDLRRGDGADQGSGVAIKLLRPEFSDRPQCIARLRREFHQTQSVAHPNVVRFYDLDCDRGNWFIAMELLVGEPLGRRLRHECPPGLPAPEALRIAVACGDALIYAHEHGVTHGDVKPDNVFVTSSGEVRMLDFGVAPDAAPQPSPADHAIVDPVLGAATRAYASPEVLTGQAPEPRDDVFSLACMIYEMLAGRHPYGRRGADEARDAGVSIERLPSLSAQQWCALAAGLAWRRGERPDIRQLLRALSSDVPEFAPVQEFAAVPVRIVAGQLLPRSSRKWRGPAVIGIAIALGILIGRLAFDSQIDSQSGSGSAAVAADTLTALPSSGNSVHSVADLPVTIPPTVAPPSDLGALQESIAPGLIAFDAASMVVSKRAVVAPVPVRHFNTARRSVTVAWRVLDGTAVSGRDFGGPQSGVAKFAEGHTFRMIYVPLLGDAAATGDRSFTVQLTDPSPGVSLGPTNRIVVTILDDD